MLTHATQSILALGVFGVFIGMLLESCYIPVPSEIILPYAGYLAYSGRTSLPAAMIAGLLGGLVGALIGFWIARYGGRPLVERYGRYVGLRRHEMDRADAWFQRHGDGAVFFGRLLPGIRTYISLPAGVADMPVGRFLGFTFLGALPWTVLFTYLGYALGPRWKSLGQSTHYFLAVVIVLFIVWIVLTWFRRRSPKA
ncbi:DedA family protein [Sulfobacillus harzensis]|uniref:DedA family protein n=1 Tax=Sulfobacillus harzensis TaxID=2729629 RepID=A0A7Y0L048_9FIRM|nr:DedA family protein [Sulfobacillus harzensis]NMP20826.1 DedA family protein [Sulfobacillus harzensis]